MASSITHKINRTIDDFAVLPPGASWVPLTYVPVDTAKVTTTLLGAGALSVRVESTPRSSRGAVPDPLSAVEYRGEVNVSVTVLWPDQFDVTPGEVLKAAEAATTSRH